MNLWAVSKNIALELKFYFHYSNTTNCSHWRQNRCKCWQQCRFHRVNQKSTSSVLQSLWGLGCCSNGTLDSGNNRWHWEASMSIINTGPHSSFCYLIVDDLIVKTSREHCFFLNRCKQHRNEHWFNNGERIKGIERTWNLWSWLWLLLQYIWGTFFVFDSHT